VYIRYKKNRKELLQMKRIPILLAVCLALSISALAVAASSFHYKNAELGFSFTIPGVNEKDVLVRESGNCVNFFHAPSYDKYGGLIGSIEVISPRSDFFAGHYDNMAYRILAMGADQVFLWRSPGGGVNTGNEFLDSYRAISSAFSTENLREALIPARPDEWPVLQTTPHLAYLPVHDGLACPDAPLTRGDLANMLYTLLDADNKSADYQLPFKDVVGKDCARAAAYLTSYGILAGYADGTFRPEAPVSRAAFAVLLHRCQFAVPVGRYGDKLSKFTDVPVDHWAEAYIDSADILGWMRGGPDGLFHPERSITRAEAVTAINRMLGRDESMTVSASTSQPFSDLTEGHWAYANILEATGYLDNHISAYKPPEAMTPENADVFYFVSSTDGWAAAGAQLFHTKDAGRTWEKLGIPFPFTVSGLFFFDAQNGVLLGYSRETPCILLETTDGGQTWSDLLADPAVWADHLPAEQFPTEKSLMESIVSAELRPAARTAVYLTIRYRPYESIYIHDLEAVRQTVITAGMY